MPRNKYQRRRALRPSTAAPSLIQNELFQHPIQQPSKSPSSSDLGREDARQLRERNNRNTRYIDKPKPTTSQNALIQAQERQQAASRSVQRQVLGEQVTSSLKPSGRYVAPSVPPRTTMQLVGKGGAMRLVPVPSIGVSLVAAGASYVIEQAAQPVISWMAEKLARGIYAGYETVFGDTDGMTFDELQAHHRQIEREHLERIQRYNDKPEAEPKPARKFNKTANQPLVSTPKPLVHHSKDAVPEEMVTVTEPQFDERNREYQSRRAELGDNPTKQQMDAVRDYGLEQHRRHFQHLYQ